MTNWLEYVKTIYRLTNLRTGIIVFETTVEGDVENVRMPSDKLEKSTEYRLDIFLVTEEEEIKRKLKDGLISSVTFSTSATLEPKLSDIDLTQYVKKTELNQILDNLDLSNYYTKKESDRIFLTAAYEASDKPPSNINKLWIDITDDGEEYKCGIDPKELEPMFKMKGNLPTKDSLPFNSNQNDVYKVESEGNYYVYNYGWELLGGKEIDLSNYVTLPQIKDFKKIIISKEAPNDKEVVWVDLNDDPYDLIKAIEGLDLLKGLDLKQYVKRDEIANLLKNAEIDLTNYYTKAETYNKTEVYNKLESDKKYLIKGVEVTDNPTDKRILWVDPDEEQPIDIVNMEEYYTKQQTNNLFMGKGYRAFVAQKDPPVSTDVLWIDTDDNLREELYKASSIATVNELVGRIDQLEDVIKSFVGKPYKPFTYPYVLDDLLLDMKRFRKYHTHNFEILLKDEYPELWNIVKDFHGSEFDSKHFTLYPILTNNEGISTFLQPTVGINQDKYGHNPIASKFELIMCFYSALYRQMTTNSSYSASGNFINKFVGIPTKLPYTKASIYSSYVGERIAVDPVITLIYLNDMISSTLAQSNSILDGLDPVIYYKNDVKSNNFKRTFIESSRKEESKFIPHGVSLYLKYAIDFNSKIQFNEVIVDFGDGSKHTHKITIDFYIPDGGYTEENVNDIYNNIERMIGTNSDTYCFPINNIPTLEEFKEIIKIGKYPIDKPTYKEGVLNG